MSAKIAKLVTDQFLAMLENGEVEGTWSPCWNRMASLPVNAVTGRHYNGINILLLWSAQNRNGFTSAHWATYKTWKSVGAQVKKGAKAQMIVFWKIIKKTDASGDESTFLLLRYHNVFNADQVEGWDGLQTPVTEFDRNAECERIIQATGADIRHGGDRACFIPSVDQIHMPMFETFHHAEGYYSTVFHELAHWTGHKSRLDRDLSGRFGSHAYGMEELVAELSAAFTCASLGFESQTRDSHLKYIKGWIETIRENNYAVITAASKAEKATRYILNGGAIEDQATEAA